MTDIIDQANCRAQMDLDKALEAARKAPAPTPYTGYCYNCGVALPPSMRYCDKDCCADYEYRTTRRACK